MTTSAQTSTGTYLYHAVFFQSGFNDPRDVSRNIRGLADLFLLSELFEHARFFETQYREAYEEGIPAAGQPGEATVLDPTRRFLEIRRLSLNSPLEIVLAVSGSITLFGATVYLTGRRALDLFDRYNRSRETKGLIDLKLKAYELMEQDMIERLTARQRYNLAQDRSVDMDEVMNSLRSLERLEAIDTGQPGTTSIGDI